MAPWGVGKPQRNSPRLLEMRYIGERHECSWRTSFCKASGLAKTVERHPKLCKRYSQPHRRPQNRACPSGQGVMHCLWETPRYPQLILFTSPLYRALPASSSVMAPFRKLVTAFHLLYFVDFKQRSKWLDKNVKAKGKLVPFLSSSTWKKPHKHKRIIRNIILFEKRKFEI